MFLKLLQQWGKLLAQLQIIAQLQADSGVQSNISSFVTDIQTLGVPVMFSGAIEGLAAKDGPVLLDGINNLIAVNNKAIAALQALEPTPAP